MGENEEQLPPPCLPCPPVQLLAGDSCCVPVQTPTRLPLHHPFSRDCMGDGGMSLPRATQTCFCSCPSALPAFRDPPTSSPPVCMEGDRRPWAGRLLWLLQAGACRRWSHSPHPEETGVFTELRVRMGLGGTLPEDPQKAESPGFYCWSLASLPPPAPQAWWALEGKLPIVAELGACGIVPLGCGWHCG